MAARIKKHENLTEANLQHVISLLRAEKPITKKEACSILNISYNTTRLNKLIEEHEETVRYRELRKAQNKGKGVTEAEKKSIDSEVKAIRGSIHAIKKASNVVILDVSRKNR